MVPDAGKMHFRHSDQQNSSGGGPRPPHWLRNVGARRVGLHTTWSAPQAKNPSYAPGHRLKRFAGRKLHFSGSCKFPTNDICVFEISILPLNFPKFSLPNCVFLEENFTTGKNLRGCIYVSCSGSAAIALVVNCLCAGNERDGNVRQSDDHVHERSIFVRS